MKKLSLEVKAPCPCPLAMNFIKNVLKKCGVKVISYYYNPQGFAIIQVESKNKKDKIVEIITNSGFIANVKGGDKNE